MQQPNLQRLEDVTATVNSLTLSNSITVTAVNAKNLVINNNNSNSVNNNLPDGRFGKEGLKSDGYTDGYLKDGCESPMSEKAEEPVMPGDDPLRLRPFEYQKVPCTTPLREERMERRFSFNKDLVIKPVPVQTLKSEVPAFVLHSWHPHVYAKPPKTPTPHSILDILGAPRKKMCFSPSIIVRGAPGTERAPPSDEADEDSFDEPLNLCVSKSRDVSPSSSISSRTVTPPLKVPLGMDSSGGRSVNGRPDFIVSSPGKLIHHLKGKSCSSTSFFSQTPD